MRRSGEGREDPAEVARPADVPVERPEPPPRAVLRQRLERAERARQVAVDPRPVPAERVARGAVAPVRRRHAPSLVRRGQLVLPRQRRRAREKVGPAPLEERRVDAPDGVGAERRAQRRQVGGARMARVVAAVAAARLVADEQRHKVPRADRPQLRLREREALDRRGRHQVRLRHDDRVRQRTRAWPRVPRRALVATPAAHVGAQAARLARRRARALEVALRPVGVEAVARVVVVALPGARRHRVDAPRARDRLASFGVAHGEQPVEHVAQRAWLVAVHAGAVSHRCCV